MQYVAYYRVSTQKQGVSGLGLEAQQNAVECFCKGANIVGEFVEIESGKKDTRPQLNAAIAQAKATGARLIVAKLDRLSRNVAFTSALLKSGIDFVCCDIPGANKLTIHLIAAIAENEREMISERTRAALAAKKARGAKLGAPDGANFAKGNAVAKSVATRKAKAVENENTRRASAFAKNLKANGATLRFIASELNKAGFQTANGRAFFAASVSRLL